MDRVALASVENSLYIKRNRAWRIRDNAIKKGRKENIIKTYDDMGKIYDTLMKQVGEMMETDNDKRII